jgi:uncharacterized phage protein gp47/JayE
VTADLQVYPVTLATINIFLSVTPYTPDIVSAITNNLRTLLESTSRPGNTVYISHIRDAVMNSGVTNYVVSAIQKNSVQLPDNTDIPMVNFEYPWLGSVTIAAL